MPASPSIHATCFVIDGHGILLRGPSGAGKSRIALHFIETAAGHHRTACLVADDRVYLHAEEGRLIATVPDTIAGLIERRNPAERDLGIEKIAFQPSAPVSLIVDILSGANYFVAPAEQTSFAKLEGITIRHVAVPDNFALAIAKIEEILPFL